MLDTEYRKVICHVASNSDFKNVYYWKKLMDGKFKDSK